MGIYYHAFCNNWELTGVIVPCSSHGWELIGDILPCFCHNWELPGVIAPCSSHRTLGRKWGYITCLFFSKLGIKVDIYYHAFLILENKMGYTIMLFS